MANCAEIFYANSGDYYLSNLSIRILILGLNAPTDTHMGLGPQNPTNKLAEKSIVNNLHFRKSRYMNFPWIQFNTSFQLFSFSVCFSIYRVREFWKFHINNSTRRHEQKVKKVCTPFSGSSVITIYTYITSQMIYLYIVYIVNKRIN